MELRMDKKEEGEISLDDVSSPEEVPQYSASWWTRSQRTENSRIHGRREVAIPLQDAVHGKENRRHARGNFSATKYTVAKLQEKNDLLPISSDEEVEYVGLPGSSYQLPIRCGKKRRKKKKKKKGSGGGDGNLSINDYVSLVDSDPDIIPININKEIIPPRRSPSPVFKRRRSPVGKSREYSTRSPPKSYSPNYRYRMEIRHSRSTSPKRKSPRKFRSPRRSPSNTSYGGSSPDLKRKKNHHMSDGYDELYATSLLKRVRRLDGVGTLGSVLQQRAKEGPSLKEKLIMMENHSDVNAETVGVKKENEMKPEKIVKNETEGEDDLEILRRQALETKKSGEEASNSKAESIVDGNDESAGKNQIERQDGTDDLEDLELRLIALRSAMIKKYQDRVKKGGPKKTKTHREESPFSDSYLFQNTKDEQSGSEKSSSSWSPMSQSPDYPESIAPSPKVEECEIEIDSPPYSPTDDVMSQSQMEFELAERKRKLIEGNSHNEITDRDYIVPEFETPYSPSGMHTSDKNSSSSASINGNLDIEDNSSFERLVDGDPEIPYSPTDPLFTLPCDLEMAKSSESLESTPQIIEKHSPIKKIPSKPDEVEKHPLDEDLSKLMPLEFLCDGSMSPNDSLITIDEIQEIQEEQHLPVGNSEPTNLILNIANNSVRREDNNIDEPLYLQGVPDVTKDVNKIPTLVNRSLVPATILKTNKKLQQPLPSKKLDPVVEPAFISATMQPVNFDIGKSIPSNAVFKPIKLQPVLKKPVAIASPAAVFNTLLITKENTGEIKKENDSKIAENMEGNIQKMTLQEIVPPLVKDNPGNQIIEGNVKKKKKSHTRKSSCRKNLQKIQKKIDESSILTRGENHGDSSKINKQDVEKLTENLCHKKSNEKNKKNDEMKEKELRERLEAKRKRRSKSTHSSEKYEKHSKQNIKNDIVIEKNDGKTPDGKDNQKPLGIMKSKKSEKEKKVVEEKRRRASMDDDEETLRALLLASLPKRQKPVEAKVPEPQIKIPENIEKKTIEEEFKKPTVSVENLPKTSATVSRVVLPVGKSLSPNNFIVSVPNITNSINTTEKVTIPLSEVPEGKKRAATVIVNPAPTKVLRKVTIPVSSIPSNNTKTMQNTFNQKNMALQNTQNVPKAPTTIISTHRNMTVNNVKINENIRPSSPKLFSSRNCRLVINLGEDSDTDSDPSSEQRLPSNEHKESTALPEPDFEKSLEAFLKDQRKKQESVAATSKPMTSTPVPTIKPSSSKKLTGLASTPLAVRHLSASRQEEYRRLKQQILERERQKLHRTIESSLQSLGNKINSTSLTPPGPLSPASPINKPNKLSPVVKALGSDVKQIGTNVQDSPIVDKKNAQITEKTVEENTSISNSTSVTGCSEEIMKNLSIHIPNDNKAVVEPSSVENKNVSEKENVNTKEVPVQNTPVLKILTSDQVNMKFSDNILPHLVEENASILSCQTPVVKISDREPETCQIANESSPIELSANENLKSNSMDMDTLEASDRRVEPSRISSLTKESNLEPIIDNPNGTIVLDDSRMEECSVKEEQSINEPIGEILGTPLKKSPTKSKRNKSPSKELSEKIKSDVKVEMESFTSLCEDEQKEKLIEIEGQLVAQRYAVLDDLTQMTHTLKQWDIERELQTRMATEVRQLRNQLKVAEERLKKQRKIISQMGPKVIESHVTIINHRAECHKLTKLCQGIGQKVAGQDYKVPSTCQQLMIDTLKKVAFHMRQLSQKKLPSIEPNEQTNKICDSEQKIASSEVRENLRTMRLSGDSDHSIDSQSNQSDDVLVNNLIRQNDQCDSPPSEVSGRSNEGNSDFATLNEDTCLPNGSSIPCASEKINKETSNAHEKSRVISNNNSDDDGEPTRPVSTYKSVLTGFQSLRHIDPNGVLCPYEMMGVCGDEGCPYNHLDTNRKRS